MDFRLGFRLGASGGARFMDFKLGLRLGLFRFDFLIFDRSLDLFGVHRPLT